MITCPQCSSPSSVEHETFYMGGNSVPVKFIRSKCDDWQRCGHVFATREQSDANKKRLSKQFKKVRGHHSPKRYDVEE